MLVIWLWCLRQLKEHMELTDNLISVVQERIDDILNQYPYLQEKVELLTSIPGVGECTAIGLVARLSDVSEFANAKQLASFAGLNPSIKESGSLS